MVKQQGKAEISLCSEHSGMVADIKALQISDEKQWKEIDGLRSRLPVWATIAISLLTFGLGATATYASMAIKIAEMSKAIKP